MTEKTQRDLILSIAEERGLVTDKDVRELGIHPQTLSRLVASGELVRAARGRYRLPDQVYELTEYHGLVLASAVVPNGVVCLLSALHFHVIGTQLPRQIWISLPKKSWTPAAEHPPMRFVRMSGEALTSGIDEHVLEVRPVKIYDVAKTVVDCFKFRNKIGMDVALEALNESWRERKLDLNLVAKYARVCRVWNVMRPYLEAITA